MTPEVVVLCYHAVSDSWPDDTAVKPDDLAAHIELLQRRGYRGATFTEAVTDPEPKRVFAVTFDDAATSVWRHAAPILSEREVPGTVFVPTAYVEQGAPMAWSGLERWAGGKHAHELTCMTWNELSALAERGWEVGSHTCSHPHLTELRDRALREELVESKRACERFLDRPCTSIAYPYGDVDARVEAAARQAGYVAAAAVPTKPVAASLLCWPRVGVYRGEGPWRVWLRVRRRALGGSTSGRWLEAIVSPGARVLRAIRR